jgi:hypothetical protein
VLFSIQSWLTETPAQKSVASTPAYLSVGMAALSLGVGTYIIIAFIIAFPMIIIVTIVTIYPFTFHWMMIPSMTRHI